MRRVDGELVQINLANAELNRQEISRRVTISAYMPVNMEIEITNKCNLKCITCPRTWQDFQAADLSLDTFKKLEPMFPYLKNVSLFGIGESLMNRQFPEMLRIISRYPVNTYFVTNGTYLNE